MKHTCSIPVSARAALLASLLLALLPAVVDAQGPVLWEVQEDIDGGTDLARAITLSRRTAIVVGNATVPLPGPDDSDFVVRALGKVNGAMQWSTQLPLSVGTLEPIYAASRRSRVYAVGTAREADVLQSGLLVRAFDTTTGALLWEDAWHPGSAVDGDHPNGIVSTSERVIVIGSTSGAPSAPTAAVVRVYDPETGVVLWEDRFSPAVQDAIPWTVVANQQRVLVAGTLSPVGMPASRDLFVRAYDAASGLLLWEMTRPQTMPAAVKLAAGRAVVAGSTSGQTYLASFAASTGRNVWEDAAPIAGSIFDLAVGGGRIVAGVGARTNSRIRAYDARTGRLEWEHEPAPVAGRAEGIAALALNGNTVFAVGGVSPDFPGGSPEEFLVRAHDAETGSVRWEDRSHPSQQTRAVDVALGPRRLFVAGYTTNESGNTDFLIRAYRIEDEE